MVKHRHAEAFKLMTYECEACGFQEKIWNSRDGVTPFMVDCRHCFGGDARHVNWSCDVYAPDHKPQPGERIFVDLSIEEAVFMAGRELSLSIYVEALEGRLETTDVWGCIKKRADEIYGDGRHPHLITVE